MTETKNFRTIEVASTLSGIQLDESGAFTAIKYLEISEWICGYPVWMHEVTLDSVQIDLSEQGYAQFPKMPTQAEATENLKAAIEKAFSNYGETIDVEKGKRTRSKSMGTPMESIEKRLPNASEVIAVIVREGNKH